LFEKSGVLTKQGNRLKYIAQDGTEILQFRKPWEANAEVEMAIEARGCLDTVMAEYTEVKSALDKVNTEEDGLETEEA
jgi:DNA-binding transcriptional regulator YhcF (GntR family)